MAFKELDKEIAFQAFYDEYSRYIRNIIRKRYPLLPQEDRADLEQESFLRIYSHLDSFSGKSSIKTWATSVVYNLCKNKFRKDHSYKRDVSKNISLEVLARNKDHNSNSNPQTAHMIDIKAKGALEILVSDEAHKLIMSRLEHLEDKHSQPIIEVFLKEKSYAEAAKSLGISKTTLRARLCRGKALLKNIINKQILSQRKRNKLALPQ